MDSDSSNENLFRSEVSIFERTDGLYYFFIEI